MDVNKNTAAGARKTPRLRRERTLTLLSCFAVILVLLVTFAVLLRSINRVIRETERLLDMQTQSIAQRTTGLLDSYARLCENLTVNQQVLSFAAYDDSESAARLTVEGRALSRELSALVSVYGSDINTLAVYFVRSGTVVSMARSVDRANNYKFFNSYPGLTPEMMETMPAGQYWDVHFADAVDAHHWVIRKVQNMGMTVAYVIVEYNLEGFVRSTSTNDSLVLIGSGEELLYASYPQTEELSYSALYSHAVGGAFTLDGTVYTACADDTRFPGIRIVTGVPVDQLSGIRRMFLVVMVVAGALVLLSIWVLLSQLNRRLFAPVEYLMQTSHHREKDTQKAIQHIADDLVATRTANESMRRERSSLLPLALGRQLNHLAQTSNDGQALLYAQSCLLLANLSFEEGFAMFAVCCGEDKRNFFKELQSDPHISTQEGVFLYLLNNILADLLFPQFPGAAAPFREDWYLVLCACGSGTGADQIRDVTGTLKAAYESTFETVLVCTEVVWGATPGQFIGSVQTMSKEISYRDFWGHLRQEQTADAGPGPDTFPHYRKMVRRLFARLNAKDYEGIPDMLDKMFDQALPTGVENIQITKYRIYALAALIITAIDEQMGDNRDFSTAHNFEPRLYSTDSITSFKQEVQKIFAELVEYKQQQDVSVSAARRMEEIKQYILLHYTENELTAASIAAAFKMNGSYLSRAFKEYAGMNILEFIQRQRVEAAKKLLRTESVRAAAQQVGFWDTQGLVRAFKKYENLTPSEYKKLLDLEDV